MKALRVAVIGAGVFGRFHANLLKAEPEMDLVAVADPTDAARALGESVGVPSFTSYQALWETVKPEAVVIATPNATHSEIGIFFAERGVHILVEKPIADTIEGAEALIDVVNRAGVVMLVGHHRRFDPVIERAKGCIDAGELGRVATMHAFSVFRKPDAYYEVPWRVQAGGGTILINVIHDIDIFRYLLGDMTDLQALLSSDMRGLPVEDTGAIAMKFHNGAIGTITASDTVAAPWSWEATSEQFPDRLLEPQNSAQIMGTAASLSVPMLELWDYNGAPDWGSPFKKRVLQASGPVSYVAQARHFHRTVRGLEPVRITGADGLETLRCTLAVHQSAKAGRKVILT